MTKRWQSADEPLVLHVIPNPTARGAQREARAIADELDEPGVRAHRVLSLFDGPPGVRTDCSLGCVADPAAGGYHPLVVPKLRAALDGVDPEVVVAHGGDPLKYVVPAMLGRRRPLVYYAIGTYAGARDRRLQVRLWRTLAARVDAVAAEGPETAVDCIDLLGVPSDRVTMVPNGRDPSVFAPAPAGAERATPTVTFLGALTAGKRPDRFVEVVAALRAGGRDLDALMIGDGPLRQRLAATAAAAGVELLGSRSDIAELLRRTDILVFPSRRAGEGLPGVLIEAGLCEVPVVATDVPGVRTIVEHGTTGLVVGEEDLAGMVSATGRLLDEAALREAMGQAARTRCVKLFSLEAVASAWLDVLGPLLPGGSDRRRA